MERSGFYFGPVFAGAKRSWRPRELCPRRTPGSRARNFPARRFRARGRPGGPCGQGRRGWLSTSPPGIGPSAQKKGGRSLLFMRGFYDIAALSRVLRKVALSRPASVATGDLRAPGRRSKLSIRRCRVLPVPTLSPRSFSLFYSFGIIGSRAGERISSLPATPFYRFFLLGDLGGNGVFSFWVHHNSLSSRTKRKRRNTHSRKLFP